MKKVSLLCLCGAVLLGFGVTDNVSAQTTMGTIKVPVGATGKSAYQIWQEAGNTGSEADFLASLVGATGAAGQDGAPGCATTITKSKVGGTTTLTATDCNNTTVWTETVQDGTDGAAGQDGAPGCADKVDISDKNAQGCYTITKTPYSLVNDTCTAGTPVNKLVCDGAPGTNGTNCEPTFSSAHDATNKKTVVTISGCGSTSTVDIPDGQDGNDGAPGTNGVGICDNVANPATAVKTYTKTYTAPTATKAGYVRLAQTMCNDITNNTDYEDTCVPVVSSNKDICSGNSGMYMECVRQDTSAVYNICRPITTQNASAISTAIDAAQTAAETYTDNAVANKVTSSDVNSAISTALSDYDTSAQVTNKITSATSNKVTTDSLNTTLSSYLQTANLGTALKDDSVKTDLADAVTGSGALSGYSTTAQMNSALANKADTSALSSYLQTANLGTALKDNSVKTDLASAVAGSGALTGYLTSADASSTYATQTALNTADGKITALETTVGDSNSGLVKQVATNTSTIGNASGGLVKDVADAKTSAANAVSTANTASTDATQAKQDAASALSGLDDKLNKTDAQSTYLSKTDATSTYLKQTDASSTYLTQNNASSTYATKSALTTVETTANNAANDASSALSAAQSAQTTASGHTSQINTLNTTVGIGTAGANSVLGRLGTVETTVNGTCSGTSISDGGNCTQGLQAQLTDLRNSYTTLQNNYSTLSANYTALQNRVAAVEQCATGCSAHQ